MKSKLFFYIFFLTLLASFASAEYIEAGSLFFPDSVTWTYNVTTAFTCDNITVNDTCVVINGGTHAGDYCFNQTSMYIEDRVLFTGTPITCFTETDLLTLTYPVNYEWLDSADAIITSGNTVCEDSTLCTVNTLSGSDIPAFGDSVRCRITITESFFTFTSTSGTELVHDIGICDATRTFPVMNLTYFDELNSSDNIIASNTYDVSFSTGFGNVDVSGFFENNKSDVFCTDVDPAADVLSLIFYGEMILSSTDYITRVFNIPLVAGFSTSNNPVTTLNLTLIKAANSTTMTYNWLTTEFQSIDGTMMIYRCEPDGSRTLIESVLISSGTAFANIELLTTAYSYEIEVDGTIYTGDSFTTCHTESTNSRTFYVDITQLNLLPVIGLFLVDCSLTKTAPTVVRMSWDSNTEDTGDITACMIAKRKIADTWTEIYRNCTTAPYGNFSRSVPDTGNAYILYGEITQGENTAICQNEISFFIPSGSSELFNLEGLVAIAIIYLVLSLIFAENGTQLLLSNAVALSLGFILSIFKLEWTVLYTAIAYILALIIIGRYTRKKAVD